ncbi:FadR family transcriptional regulator [Candidatus Bipolaricaulota bacterium]|nr:FadR family transcriptional regulator [Candidatus Bipolaricaulota bacterium]
MTFEKVRPRKVTAIAAEQVVEAIQRGDYPVGSKLPSEFELAEQMGVSRPSIREALSALQAMEIIESRPGSGNFVLRLPTSSEEQDTVLLIESEAGCREVMEARQTLEPPVAALVAANRVPGVIESLRGILGEMRTYAENNAYDAYIGADKSFHLALANAAGNSLVTSAVTPLLDTMDQKVYREFTRQYYLKDESDLNHVVDLHSEILEAIVEGDSDTAFSRMVEHWTRMRSIWEA